MSRAAGIAFIAAIFLSLALIGCGFDYSNPVDPSAKNYEGIATVATAGEIRAERAFASPSDGSAVPVFVCSRVVGATDYNIQLSATSDFSGTLLLDAKSGSASNEVPAASILASLADGAWYYWRGRALVGTWGAWSPSTSFQMRKVTGLTIGPGQKGSAGSTASMTYTLQPGGVTCGMVTWASSNSTAVGVDALGTLSFATPGALSIVTVTSADGGFTSSQVASVLLSSAANPTFIAGSTSGSPGSANGTGSGASFNTASGICFFGGKLYVADSGNNDVRCVDTSTRQVTRVAGNPASSGSTDGVGTLATFHSPGALCTDGTCLYVADYLGYVIRRVEIATGTVSTLAGSGINGGSDGIGTAAAFGLVLSICTDGLNLYALESQKIRKIVIQTGQVTTLYSSISGDSYQAICTDGSSLYFTNSTYNSSGNTGVLALNLATGVVSALAGSSGHSFNSADGIGVNAAFAGPKGICTDGVSLFVCDLQSSAQQTSTLRKIDLATKAVGTIATSSSAMLSAPSICTDGSSLYYPLNVAIFAIPIN